ncbi:MAG: glycoside hydrolase family 13 protein, partial [Arenimonas sp.]
RGEAATVPAGQTLVLARADAGATVGNLVFDFSGEQTLRLAFPGGQPTLGIGPKSFDDPAQRPVENLIARSLRHDSRAISDRAPFGALAAGGSVTFSIASAAGVDRVDLVIEKRRLEGNQDVLEYTPVARVPMRGDLDPSGAMRWQAAHTFGEIGVYGYWFDVVIAGEHFVYQNNRQPIYWTRETGVNGVGVVAPKPAGERGIRRYRMTIFRADFTVPAWASDAVYYYIFPERFRNGDRSNDPQPGVDRYHDQPVEFHVDWNEKPYKPGTGDGSDAVYSNDFFGGDIAGIIEKLDYIADLGANTLYITPLWSASSNHKYDTADYRNVDRHFGSNDDFSRLTREAGRRGIRVIPDASLNHTGRDSIYFDRFGKYGGVGAFAGGRINPDSPYSDWYRFDASQSDPEKQYKGWVGVVDLPELDKSSASFRRFAYADDDSIMKTWLDRGAAGWRMDVAPWVPDDFWREWRSAIKQHSPDALTIAETWFDSSKYFLGDTFDSTMNYIFRDAVLAYAKGGDARVASEVLEYLREVYPPQSFHALMNLLSTHDVARSLALFGYASATDSPEQVALAKQKLRLAAFFQMVYPGAPAIYYGDEVGVTGGEDPFNRATSPWPDRGGKPDLALLADYKRMLAVRKATPVLRRGELLAPLHVDEHVIVLGRRDGKDWAVTATNNADAPATVEIALPAECSAMDFEDALTHERVVAVAGRLRLVVPARFGAVLLSR